MNRLPLSVLIITHNEQRCIERCLRSVGFADEIVVVDAQSSDRTPQICQDQSQPWASQMRFVTRAWTGFKDQRNHALDLAKHDWVFVIDADEACTPELELYLRSFFAQSSLQKPAYYKVHRQEYFLGHRMNYGIWNPSYQDRFFHKTGIRYVNDVHEYPEYPVPREQQIRIHAAIDHDPTFGPQRFFDKMNKYTGIEARDRVQQGRRTNAFRLIAAFPAMFLKNYFYYRAYRDGMPGLVVSVMEGISRAVRHVKMWEYQQELVAKREE